MYCNWPETDRQDKPRWFLRLVTVAMSSSCSHERAQTDKYSTDRSALISTKINSVIIETGKLPAVSVCLIVNSLITWVLFTKLALIVEFL